MHTSTLLTSIFLSFAAGLAAAFYMTTVVDRSASHYYEIVTAGEAACKSFDGWKQADLSGNYTCNNGVEVTP